MALFSSKKNTKKEAAPVEAKAAAPVQHNSVKDIANVLRHARITEKASMQQGMNVYTFDIASSATKRDVGEAIRSLYKVTPRKIAVVTVPSKNVRSARSGKRGVKSGGRKAYVFLKKGDSINL